MPFLSITSLVSRSAVSKPATRLYPFEKREPYQATRGRIEFVIDNCIFCNLCAKKCPTDAIVCNKEDRTWEIDHGKCILCGNCVDSCRKGCLTQVNVPATPYHTQRAEYYKEKTEAPSGGDAEAPACDTAQGSCNPKSGDKPAAD